MIVNITIRSSAVQMIIISYSRCGLSAEPRIATSYKTQIMQSAMNEED